MTHIEDILLWAVSQSGDQYIFGAETSKDDPNPDAFDCSELVEWSCARAGTYVPDGAYNQWRYASARGTACSVDDAIRTRGALLFRGPGRGVGRAFIDHVAFSLGDGTTIEARGTKWGVGSFTALNRGWGWAVRIPDVDYSPRAPLPAPVEPSQGAQEMRFYRTEHNDIYAVYYARAENVLRLVKAHVTGSDWAWLGQPESELRPITAARIAELVDA